MAITFPTDPPVVDTQAVASVGGAEKYDTLDGAYINVLNIGSASITSLNADVITTGTLSADRIGANSITANKLSVSQLSAITADMGSLTAGTITGANIYSSSSSTKIHLDNGDYIRFYQGGSEKARIRGSAYGGIIQEIGNYYLANDKSYLVAETSGTAFGRWGVNSSNQMMIVLPSTNQFFVKNAAEDFNIFTVSRANGGFFDEGTGGTGLRTLGNFVWYDSKLESGRSRYVFKDTGGTERLSITPAASPNTKITLNGTDKYAIMQTAKGFNALYCVESPEVWFMDFCWGKKIRKFPKFWKTEWQVKPDPTFMEVIEGQIVVMPTGVKNIVQIWGKRKGHADKRFETKTKEEYDKNEAFLNMAKL